MPGVEVPPRASRLARGAASLERARRALGRSAPALVLLAAILLGLATWLLFARGSPSTPDRPGLRALLVDLSASVTRARPDHERWLRRALLASTREARAAREDLLVVEFASDVRGVWGPGSAAGFEALLLGQAERTWHPDVGASGDLASELCGTIELARAELLAAGRARGRIELFADGAASDGDARAALESLARAGVRATQHPLPERATTDLAIAALVAPRELEEGAPLSIAVDLELAAPGARPPAGEIELSVELSHERETKQASRRLELPESLATDASGRARWTARMDLGPLAAGRWEIAVRARRLDVDGASGDPIPENDAARAPLRVRGSLVCALVLGEELREELRAERGAWLAGAPGLVGIEVLEREPALLAALLADLDLVVTADVAPADLPGAALASFVRAGGAWVAFDGWRALAGGGLVSDLVPGAAASILPLRADSRSLDERDVVLLVDGSGSMQGEPFERARSAVHELVLGVPPNDRVELRLFTATLGPIAFEARRGQTREERAAAASALLLTRVPGGSTDVIGSLEELARLLGAEPTPALVILLTDGRTAPGAADRGVNARASLSRANAELRVIAIGEQADEGFLATLLLPGETLVRGGDLADLAGLLAREVHAERVRAGPDLVARLAPVETVETVLAREVLAAWSSAFAAGRPIARYERTQLREGAEALWLAASGDPLLALQRVGRGRVVACVSSPSSDWAPFLAAEPALLAPLYSALAREGERGERERVELDWEDERMVLEGVPPDWPPLLDARFLAPPVAGSAAGKDLGRALFQMPPQAPGRDPRTVRVAPRPELTVPLSRGERLELELSAPDLHEILVVAAPLPAELSASPVPDLAADLPEPEAKAATRTGAPHPLAVPLLGLGLALLFVAAVEPARRGQAAPGSGRQ